MKKLLFILSLSVAVATGCSKQNATPTAPLDEMVDTLALGNMGDTSIGSTLKYSGTFMNGNEGTVAGIANIYFTSTGKYQLELKDFSVTNGPDLHVYLSKEVQPIHFIDLGKLKSTKGNQLYDISGTPDFSMYKYALIHCQQYDVVFGKSELVQ